MKTKTLALVAGAFLLTTACGMPAAGSGSSSSGSRNVITHEQMVEVGAQSAYDAVQRLQANWLSTRGPSGGPNVYQNGTRVGDVDYLRSLRAEDVAQLRFFTAGEAGARFGMGNDGGVIEVTAR